MKEKFDELIKGNVPVLIDFSAEWCSPCKMMGPVLDQLKDKMANKIRIVKIDVDNNRELAGRYRIQSVPTLMLFQGGKAKWSGVGVMTSNHLENIINNNSSLLSD
jgi:thioredoxin 1